MYILILVCESLMSKICKALQHHLKNTIKHATWGVSACRFFAGMTFQRERQKSFGSFGIYPLVICCIISYWTWQFIADIAIKNCIFPYFSIVMFVYQRVHVFKRSGVIKRGWKLPYLCYPAIHLQLGISHQWPGPFLQKAAAYLRKPSDSKKYTIPQLSHGGFLSHGGTPSYHPF